METDQVYAHMQQTSHDEDFIADIEIGVAGAQRSNFKEDGINGSKSTILP